MGRTILLLLLLLFLLLLFLLCAYSEHIVKKTLSVDILTEFKCY